MHEPHPQQERLERLAHKWRDGQPQLPFTSTITARHALRDREGAGSPASYGLGSAGLRLDGQSQRGRRRRGANPHEWRMDERTRAAGRAGIAAARAALAETSRRLGEDRADADAA